MKWRLGVRFGCAHCIVGAAGVPSIGTAAEQLSMWRHDSNETAAAFNRSVLRCLSNTTTSMHSSQSDWRHQVAPFGHTHALSPFIFGRIHDRNGATCGSTFVGKVNENVDPRPGLDSTHSRPPCNSMMRFAIASPRPVPPFLPVIDESACWNSSKIFAWSASE